MAKINIDATALDYKFFIVPGHTDWVDASMVKQLDLPPGTYNYQVGSGFYCDFTFSIGGDGKIGYDAQYDGFLDGAGSDTLKLTGFPVTLDARYLPGLGLIWSGDIPSTGWFQLRRCRLLPASHYRVQQGSGVVCDFAFKLDGKGRFQYDAALDIAAGGPLRGIGSATLEFLGFSILVDARGAGGAGLTLQPIAWGVPFATSSVVMFNILPAKGFQVQLESGIVTHAGFDLDIAGKITLHDEYPQKLKLDTFHGLARVTTQKLLVRPFPPLTPKGTPERVRGAALAEPPP